MLEYLRAKATKLRPDGRVDFDDDKFNRPGVLYAGHQPDVGLDESILPEHIKRSLDRAGELAGPGEPRAGYQVWEEALSISLADGTAVTASGTETIMLPIFTLPGGYFYPGRTVKWTLFGRQSTAITTPGTITFKLSYSAAGTGAVAVVSSGAFAPDPTAAATNLTFSVEWWMTCRTNGTTGTALGLGRVEWSDYDDASATTIVGNLNMRMAPTSAPATATIDTTVARAVSPTYTSSVGTASMTTHLGILEAIS
jgi:hypothetical protein